MTIDLVDSEGAAVEHFATLSEADVSTEWRELFVPAGASHAGETLLFRIHAATR
jgi:hypothetical protein